MQILRVVFTKPVKPLRRFWSWMFFAFTFNVLIASGWVFTGVLYLICGLMFKVVREHYRQRLDEDGLCPESL
ncbi:Uncharacterised protein [Serratia marcescens]|nr:Uncharacterised protein [Serratia marcescens]CVH14710.1 Uncharacterised protein [Serratia marcescens]